MASNPPAAYYFGCLRGVYGHRDAGHALYGSNGRGGVNPGSLDEGVCPWGIKVDGGLAPREWDSRRAPEMPQGVASYHRLGGWSAISFWDRSGDSRGNSSSSFLFDAELEPAAALAAARASFPALFERFPFEVRLAC